MGITLRAADSNAEAVVRRLRTLRDADDDLKGGEARILRLALRQELRRTNGVDERLKVAALHRQRIVEIDGGSTDPAGRVRLSPDAAHAFDVE